MLGGRTNARPPNPPAPLAQLSGSGAGPSGGSGAGPRSLENAGARPPSVRLPILPWGGSLRAAPPRLVLSLPSRPCPRSQSSVPGPIPRRTDRTHRTGARKVVLCPMKMPLRCSSPCGAYVTASAGLSETSYARLESSARRGPLFRPKPRGGGGEGALLCARCRRLGRKPDLRGRRPPPPAPPPCPQPPPPAACRPAALQPCSQGLPAPGQPRRLQAAPPARQWPCPGYTRVGANGGLSWRRSGVSPTSPGAAARAGSEAGAGGGGREEPTATSRAALLASEGRPDTAAPPPAGWPPDAGAAARGRAAVRARSWNGDAERMTPSGAGGPLFRPVRSRAPGVMRGWVARSRRAGRRSAAGDGPWPRPGVPSVRRAGQPAQGAYVRHAAGGEGRGEASSGRAVTEAMGCPSAV